MKIYFMVGFVELQMYKKAIQNLELERVRAYRVLRFANLVIKKPEQERFWFGWYRRSMEV